ncbi:MAG TPA: hypothetical protein VK735_37300 [Pseudonocardia sp.]|uniref:hypothetical protein n=1 Tax=Pseudonocardia sp. TaxID=60912 RepID=UPI002CCC65D9|nr:hypothetical protein [Pseudonocardia sp.]HTF53137.1 hypothetical protein [Pseudonocardia sp.]
MTDLRYAWAAHSDAQLFGPAAQQAAKATAEQAKQPEPTALLSAELSRTYVRVLM